MTSEYESYNVLIQQMSDVHLQELASRLFSMEPGLIFDALMMNQVAAPPSSVLTWCMCGNCREMPTDRERKCCGQGPNHCISLLPHFTLYCLEDGYLRIHRQYRNDVLVIGEAREPGDENREFRYAAYRQYIFWQHGALGQENRRVIPSCCVWRIRDKYPDPHGHYVGFIPRL
ncbi:P2X purinoceptor 7-like [Perca fluviatilis]|uniref:P2X purinoceptor 7-like n=1 Tax=Perca fluviatilis TaxID=8168 RepID=UPI0019665942|nr:P2X purinoceptor 7-like [Perca fluviatilis]